MCPPFAAGVVMIDELFLLDGIVDCHYSVQPPSLLVYQLTFLSEQTGMKEVSANENVVTANEWRQMCDGARRDEEDAAQ